MKNYARLAVWALACLIFGSVSVHAQNITTVVGGGPVGLTPTAASVGSPVAVRSDSLGNAYVLDNALSRVLKIDHTTGLISVFAGNGTTGFGGDGGPATSAAMNQPSGMCIDSNNNVFVADSDNAVIRVIIGAGAVAPPSVTGPVTAGNIYTAVGIQTSTNPEFGGDNGPALSSHLHFPDGCAFDSHGNMYIADRGNNEVRVVIGTAATVPPGLTGPLTPGNIYLFAGALGGSFPNPPAGGYAPNGSAALGGAIYGPFDVVVDGSNNVYFADLGNNFDQNGNPNTQMGQPNNNNVVREVLASNGTVTTVAGVPQTYSTLSLTGTGAPVASGVATAVALNEPKGLSVDTSGNLYFCDTINQVIRKVSGGNISVVAGSLLQHGYSGDTNLATSATLTYPAGTFVDSTGDLFIADDSSNAVRIVPLLANDGSYLLNHIYTVYGNGHLNFGGDGAAATGGQINTPAGLAVDSASTIYLADGANDLVRKVTKSNGDLSTIAGQPEAGGFLNSPIFLNAALGVATDAAGNAYIADTANCLVRKVTSAGITTIAGVAPAVPVPDDSANAPVCGLGTSGGLATSTKLGNVYSVALDSHGNVFISDKTNSVIWEVPVATSGMLVANNAYIVAGTTAGFEGDGGAATSAKLSGPTGIYIDIYDNLFIADAGNHRIREVPAVNVTAPTAMTAGFIYTIVGNGTSGSSGNGGAATSAEIATPFAIVVDHAGNVFFSDTTNQTIRKVTASSGNIGPLAGTNGTAGFSGDGAAATAATLNDPTGLALLPDATPNTTSDLLISDSLNNRVRSVAGVASNAPVALASLNPTTVTFTSEPVGTASAASTVTLSNAGGATLTVTGITITGANAGDFKETDTCTAAPGTVAAGGTCTISVVFTPSANGARTATLTVADSAFSATQSVTLNGTGGAVTPPALALTLKDTDSSSTQTVTAGATATFNLSVTSNQTTNVTATITCSGAPTAAVCTPAPGSVTVVPTTGGTFKLNITTTARSQMLPFNQPSTKMQPPSFLQIAPMASIALLFVIATMLGWMQDQAGRARTLRVAMSLCLILMPIVAATVLVGCGGGSSSGGGGGSTPPPVTGTPAGSYTITVSAAATGLATPATTTVTLVVN